MAAKLFKDAYGFGHQEPMPFFPRLLQECPLSEKVHCDTTLGDVRWVADAITPIHNLCKGFQFETILADLTIIQDERLVQRQQDLPYLINHVVCYRDWRRDGVTDPIMMNAYRKAMQYMATEAAGSDPLVPHEGFYDYLYLATPVNQHADFHRGGGEVHDSNAELSSSYRQRYPYEPGLGKQNSEEQLGRLLGEFLRQVAKVDVNLHSTLDDALLIAVPFHRSPYRPAMSGAELGDDESRYHDEASSPTAQRLASPGGATFLLVKPPVSGCRHVHWDVAVEHLARSLHSMLTLAALTESFSQMNVQLAYNDLLYTMLHGAVHVVRGIGAGDLCRAVSKRVPPAGPEDFRSKALREDTRSANSLASSLKRAMLGETVALAMLSFAEIGRDRGFDGILRRKFQNIENDGLVHIIEQAKDLVNHAALRGRETEMARVALSVAEQGPVSRGFGHWMIPADYVDAKLLVGVFAEVIRNASQYGQREVDGSVRVDCTIGSTNQSDNIVQCEFVNRFVPDNAESSGTVGGFLRRMQRVFSQLSGLGLTYKDGGNHFRLCIDLGPLKAEVAEVKGGGEREVSLVWSPE